MAKAKRLLAKTNKPPLKDHPVLLRFSRKQFAIILQASKRSGLPFAVLVRTLVLQAIERGDEGRLRGNVSAYVDARPPRGVETCAVHKGEPLYVTPEGPTCRLCSQPKEQVA